MNFEELATTIEDLVQPNKGILAADESINTIGKRFEAINTENNLENRNAYRTLLCTTPGLNEYISGVILFPESLNQAEALSAQGIVPGVKVDKGLINLANTLDEKVTQGLDGLEARLAQCKDQGARFAKWRNVYSVSSSTPSIVAIKTGAEVLARYAAICQNYSIVPIIEPEILMDGDHPIDQAAEVSEVVLQELYAALFLHQVQLEYTILKPSMVIPGKSCKDRSDAEEIAEYTISVFRNNVPAAVPSINFLSGGQSPEEATLNLNAINNVGSQPWQLSFSYGRALQEPCLNAWKGQAKNRQAAQAALLKRAKLNSTAVAGNYEINMEKA